MIGSNLHYAISVTSTLIAEIQGFIETAKHPVLIFNREFDVFSSCAAWVAAISLKKVDTLLSFKALLQNVPDTSKSAINRYIDLLVKYPGGAYATMGGRQSGAVVSNALVLKRKTLGVQST